MKCNFNVLKISARVEWFVLRNHRHDSIHQLKRYWGAGRTRVTRQKKNSHWIPIRLALATSIISARLRVWMEINAIVYDDLQGVLCHQHHKSSARINSANWLSALPPLPFEFVMELIFPFCGPSSYSPPILVVVSLSSISRTGNVRIKFSAANYFWS